MKYLSLLFFVVLIAMTTRAQPDQLTEWDVIEKCLPSPIVADEDWTFDGEILMSGWGGIHAVSAGFDTPYVVHWGYGRLSPDGQWVLKQDVRSYAEQLSGPGPMGRYHWNYGDIVVTNLDTGDKVTFDWQAHMSLTSRPYPFGPGGPYWLENNRFVAFYGNRGRDNLVGHVETGEITAWTGVPVDDPEYSVSPDGTRAVSYARLYDLSDNSLIQEEQVGSGYDFVESVWSSDSSMFVDVPRDESGNTRELTIFDRDGNRIAMPFTTAENVRVTPVAWSPDNAYLQFSGDSSYILNMREEIIYDLCTSMNGIGWSPDGTQFATVLGSGQQPVVIVGTDEWQPYIVAHHTGRVELWREKET